MGQSTGKPRRRRRGAVITDVTGKSVIEPTFVGPAIVGEGEGAGEIDWICAHCELVLAKRMPSGALDVVVIKCFKCGTLNEFGPEHEG